SQPLSSLPSSPPKSTKSPHQNEDFLLHQNGRSVSLPFYPILSNMASNQKKTSSGTVLIVGGPALTRSVMPKPEELFERYNPELQKRVIENRPKVEKEYQEFLDDLKEVSRSDKTLWEAAKEVSERRERAKREEKMALRVDKREIEEAIKRERRGE